MTKPDPLDYKMPTPQQFLDTSEDIAALINTARGQWFNLSHFENVAAAHGPAEAHDLVQRASAEARKAVEALGAMKAYFEWATDSLSYGIDTGFTASADPMPEPQATIRPTGERSSFWEGPPIWEIENDPLAGSDGGTWRLYVAEEEKMRGNLHVAVFATFGAPGTAQQQQAIPIWNGEEDTEGKSAWTAAQWVAYAKPKAEEYIAAYAIVGGHRGSSFDAMLKPGFWQSNE